VSLCAYFGPRVDGEHDGKRRRIDARRSCRTPARGALRSVSTSSPWGLLASSGTVKTEDS
jgi:hypothetical protein